MLCQFIPIINIFFNYCKNTQFSTFILPKMAFRMALETWKQVAGNVVAISPAQDQTFVMQTQDNVNAFEVLQVCLVTCANQTIMDFRIKVAKVMRYFCKPIYSRVKI